MELYIILDTPSVSPIHNKNNNAVCGCGMAGTPPPCVGVAWHCGYILTMCGCGMAGTPTMCGCGMALQVHPPPCVGVAWHCRCTPPPCVGVAWHCRYTPPCVGVAWHCRYTPPTCVGVAWQVHPPTMCGCGSSKTTRLTLARAISGTTVYSLKVLVPMKW